MRSRMTMMISRNGKFVLAGVTTVVLGLAAAGAMADRGPWGHGGGGRYYGGGALAGPGLYFPMRRVCRGDGDEMTDHILVSLEHKVKPTDAQKGVFEDLKTAMKSAAEKMRAGCPKDAAADGDKEKTTPIERLAQTEVGLAASLDAVKTLRPAAEKFYAALSDEQKAKLDRKRGWRHWRKGPRGDDDAPKGEPPAAPQQ